MYASFVTPQNILSHTFTHPDGVAGTVLCKLLTGGNFAWVGAASSVFTLANISIERYYAVMYPLGNKGKLTERKLMVSGNVVYFSIYIFVSNFSLFFFTQTKWNFIRKKKFWAQILRKVKMLKALEEKKNTVRSVYGPSLEWGNKNLFLHWYVDKRKRNSKQFIERNFITVCGYLLPIKSFCDLLCDTWLLKTCLC